MILRPATLTGAEVASEPRAEAAGCGRESLATFLEPELRELGLFRFLHHCSVTALRFNNLVVRSLVLEKFPADRIDLVVGPVRPMAILTEV